MFKKIIYFINFILFLFSTHSFADYFQLVDQAGKYNISYAPVVINEQTYYTDMYGRININLPHGSYEAQVTYNDNIRTVTLNINGSSQLITIFIK